MGWTPAGSGTTAQLFLKKTASTSHRIWVRFEYSVAVQDGYFSALSITELDQANCGDQSYVTLQQTLYAGNNLTGAMYTPEPSGRPQYAAPGTFAETILTQACR